VNKGTFVGRKVRKITPVVTMKLPSLFTKTPVHKRFGYTPRFYNAQEEERKEREARIREELKLNEATTVTESAHRTRIAGSFRGARKITTRQSDPSANLLRILSLTVLAIWLFAFFQYGTSALYALLLFVPFYLYLKFRRK
jgi:hypothetical protein